MERCDVLVVGGGPSGSSCAYGLRDSGRSVIVIDRKEFPRDKTCAGWVTPPVFAARGIDPEVYGKEHTCQPIHGFAVRRIGDREARVRSDSVVSYGIRRSEFDHYLLERCEADVRCGVGLEGVERRGAGWVVNDGIEAGLLIGAGGHFCPLARRLGPDRPHKEPVIAAKEVEYRLAPDERDRCPVQADLPELFFTEDLRGYGWVFRKGDYLNVGLGRQDRERLSDHLDAFIAFLRREGRLPKTLSDAFHGHAYLLYDSAERPLAAPGALFVGDAAGLAYPKSGEGIRPAVESGLLAARAIAAGGGFEAIRGRYERSVRERLGRRRSAVPNPLDAIPAPLLRRLAGRLFGTPWFARRVVIERWFCHAHQPPLPSA